MKLSTIIFSNKIIAFAILITLSITCSKKIPVKNDKPEPIEPEIPYIADAGPDQTVVVGSYVILNGSRSTPAAGKQINWWQWDQLASNPEKLFVKNGTVDTTISLGVAKEGTYKFTLKVKDQFDDLVESALDTTIVTVLPRSQIICEDPKLDVQIRWILKKQTEVITQQDLLSIDSLYRVIYVRDISSVQGIEPCLNLEYVSLGLQDIIDLTPLANLKKLKILNLTQNHNIYDISPLSELTNLEYLHIDNNKISDISSLKKLVKLTYLNLAYSPVQDISALTNMSELEELQLSNSELENNDFPNISNLIKLKSFWAPACKIIDLDFIKNMKKMQVLYLSYNEIENIAPLKNLNGLVRIYLDLNQVKDISPLKNLPNIGKLRLRYNKIEDILPLVENENLKNGVVINITGNPLNEKSINEYIPILLNRGCYVFW